MAAAVALVPVLIPFAGLVFRAVGGGSEALSIVWSSRTAELLVNTVLLIALVTATAGVLGVGAAWLTERTDLRARRLWRVIAALPLVIPSYVIALAYLSTFGRSGLVADLTGITLPSISGLLAAWVALSISTYPFVYLVAAAALRRLDASHEEAARGLGARPRRVFLTVVLPQLRPAMGAGLLVVSLYTLSDFGAVSLARFDAFTRVVYAQYAGRLDRTPAAVLAVVLVILAMVIVSGERGLRGRASYFSRPTTRPPRLVELSGRQRAAATSALGCLAIVSLVVPIGALIAWVVRSDGGGTSLPWGAAAGSVVASSLAAIVAVVLAVPVSVLVARYRSRPTDIVERTAYGIFALPHIAVALGVVFFASRWLGPLYQSLPLLVLVYASVFFAQALGASRSSLLQVNPVLEEASRSLGKGRFQTMTRITVPLMWRGLAAGGLLVFLTSMKELPLTLLLRPTGFDTLAVKIWSAADDLLYATAAAPALLLIAVSAVPMYVLATRDR